MRARWVLLAAFTVLVALSARVMADTHTVTRRYTPADRERERFVYVPFDVAAGTTEVRVRYAYDRAQGQNTIDLGVFEPGLLDLGTAALRGYAADGALVAPTDPVFVTR